MTAPPPELYRLDPLQRPAARELLEHALPAILADAREQVQETFTPDALDDLERAHGLLSLIGWTPAIDGPEAPVELDDVAGRNLLRRIAYAAMAASDGWLIEQAEHVIEALGWRLEDEG